MKLIVKIPILAVFSVPAVLLTAGFLRGGDPQPMLHPTGEMAIRMMVAAMLPGPLRDFFGPTRFLRGWMALRRNLGVLAFIYATLHLVFYCADKQSATAVLGEIVEPRIWTGWIAILLMLVPASISFDAAVRALRRRWKSLQQLAYPAALFSVAHWILLEWHWTPALIHLAPLSVAWTLRIIGRRRRRVSHPIPA